MSVIEAAAMRCRTMADGSLRIECEVEPRHARAAFNLFGAPGTPMALAALKPKSHKPETEAETPEKPKGGMWSQWCAIRCSEPEFQDWLARKYPQHWGTAETETDAAAAAVRAVCGIKSRAELDHDPAAKARFDERIKNPWHKHWQAVHA